MIKSFLKRQIYLNRSFFKIKNVGHSSLKREEGGHKNMQGEYFGEISFNTLQLFLQEIIQYHETIFT